MRGGEHVPKKWFEPITRGDIVIRYIFREATTEQPEIAGMYGSYLRKHLRQKRWDYASIGFLVDDYGQATDFLDSDFEEFDLVFKEKIDPQSLSDYDRQTYTKGQCHMLYQFARFVGKEEYHFYFCVNQDNYDENAKYPNKWGSLVIELW
ncbi:hypothetical protein [Conservatibacter flavescens]|nr:hypothetical protein [Conservatibacter flavescens]